MQFGKVPKYEYTELNEIDKAILNLQEGFQDFSVDNVIADSLSLKRPRHRVILSDDKDNDSFFTNNFPDSPSNLTDKPYKIFDSGGLFLRVTPASGKWWRFKYRYGGKEKQLSLGIYPEVSLTEAREKRDVFRALLKNGTNPSDQVKAERAARLAEEARQLAATRLDRKITLLNSTPTYTSSSHHTPHIP